MSLTKVSVKLQLFSETSPRYSGRRRVQPQSFISRALRAPFTPPGIIFQPAPSEHRPQIKALCDIEITRRGASAMGRGNSVGNVHDETTAGVLSRINVTVGDLESRRMNSAALSTQKNEADWIIG